MRDRAGRFWKMFRRRWQSRSGRRPPQLIWLIPIVAALIGGWLAVKTILEKGPRSRSPLRQRKALEAGKTKIKYKDVDIGDVKAIHLSDDHLSVVVTAEFAKRAAKFLVDDTRFWVVRPRDRGGQVSGLGTLFSGSYIGMDIGHSNDQAARSSPVSKSNRLSPADVPGRQFVLHTDDLSVDIGAPVYLSTDSVGRVDCRMNSTRTARA